MKFIKEPKELGFTLEPPVVFYGIFISCAILSTESSKKRLTVFRFAAFDLIFMIFPKKISTIPHSPDLLFPSFEVKIF